MENTQCRLVSVANIVNTQCRLVSVANIVSMGNTQCRLVSVANIVSVGNTQCRLVSVANIVSVGNTQCRLVLEANIVSGASLITGLEYGMERLDWKMEWNSERTQLQLTRVTGASQLRLNYNVPSVSPGLLSHRRSFMSKYGIAHHHASIC